jgi:hypothetical protein
MEEQFKIIRKTLKTLNFSIEFEYRVRDALFHDGIYIVLLDIANEKGCVDNTPVRDNVYGVDREGAILWRVEGKTIHPDDVCQQLFGGIRKDENNIIHVSTFGGGTCNIDYKTGKLSNCRLGNW